MDYPINSMDEIRSMIPEDVGALFYGFLNKTSLDKQANFWGTLYEKVVLPSSTAESFQGDRDYLRRAMSGFAQTATEHGDHESAEHIHRKIRDLGLRLI